MAEELEICLELEKSLALLAELEAAEKQEQKLPAPGATSVCGFLC